MKRWLILFILLFSKEALSAKVFDCFLFCNELEILNIRLYELYDEVDYFVLVEADTTFQGNPKPLFFEENKERFKPYLDKIIHIVVRDLTTIHDTWGREAYQRNAITRGLEGCSADDLIFVSDVDEIISRKTARTLKDHFALGYEKPVRLILSFRNCFFNTTTLNNPWWVIGSIAFPYSFMTQGEFKDLPNSIRWGQEQFPDQWPEEAGWHLTNMGGRDLVDFIIYKSQSFSHTECNTGTFDREQIDRDAKRGSLLADNASYPALILENLDYYQANNYFLLSNLTSG